MEDKEKFSTMIIDGRMVDLNTISYEELDELQAKLEKQQEEVYEQIDKILEEK